MIDAPGVAPLGEGRSVLAGASGHLPMAPPGTSAARDRRWSPYPRPSAVRGGGDGGSLPPHLTHEGGVEGHGGCGSPRSGCKECLPTRFDRALLTAYRQWSSAACPILDIVGRHL